MEFAQNAALNSSCIALYASLILKVAYSIAEKIVPSAKLTILSKTVSVSFGSNRISNFLEVTTIMTSI